jgi:hypothetical protein
MDQAIKERWVKDLRSDEYPQGKGHLRKDGKFCCLGVLCEQAVKAGIVTSQEQVDGSWIYSGDGDAHDRSASVLPYSVTRWAGISHENPVVKVNGEHLPLASLNDGDEDGTYGSGLQQRNFREIANLIEAQL